MARLPAAGLRQSKAGYTRRKPSGALFGRRFDSAHLHKKRDPWVPFLVERRPINRPPLSTGAHPQTPRASLDALCASFCQIAAKLSAWDRYERPMSLRLGPKSGVGAKATARKGRQAGYGLRLIGEMSGKVSGVWAVMTIFAS